MSVQVVVPTYNRLHRLEASWDQLHDYDVLFVCHETDELSQDAVRSFGLEPVIDTQPASGVNATNRGFAAATAEWVAVGQDDFQWHPGWLEAAQRHQSAVVGFNDGFVGHDGHHSVGWFVHRDYVMEHGLAIGHPGHVFCPDYRKNYADNELNETARFRGVWAWAHDSLVEHLHPGFAKAQLDDTYTRLEGFVMEDRDLYHSRRHLWEPE